MGRVSEVYRFSGANYFIAEDIQEPRKLRITGAETKEIKDSMKIVLTFEGEDKQLALNVTNAQTLADRFGDDTSAWIGQTVTLASVPTKFQNKSVKGLRIL